ncbi:MAG: C40 family peptidase [Halanaerobiaceae bacterium]
MNFKEFLSKNYDVLEEKTLEVAGKLMDIPYAHNGRTYEGVDCLGLIHLFFKEMGVELPIDDNRGLIGDDWYKTEPDRYIEGLKSLGEEVGNYNNLQILDVPYFRLYKNVVTHTAVMINNRRFLHILRDKNVRIDSFDRRFWRAKYAGARRLF